MPQLPGSERALQLLKRLAEDFEPVVQNRGWTVLQLGEFCCCSSGDNKKPSNVAGFCVSPGNGRIAYRICIRLRPHCCIGGLGNFYPYDELRRTMAHELAHIVHHPHNDAFFRLMDEILQEQESSTPINNGDYQPVFPMVSGRRLGTGRNDKITPILGSKELRQRIAQAAARRAAKSEGTNENP